ncbi:hypothetical protein G6F36_012662 [Rhizopus arrhizus]|nr:hypothetical protein G6F36_012662 [Rhizopus arrhizus]
MMLERKNTFEGIDEAFQPLRFNRLQQPEEYWCRESILNYLNLFINSDTIAPFNTEQDLLEDVYGFIKASKRLNSTIAETASGSNASGENKNLNRDIGSVTKIERQVSAEPADLVFKYVSSELGCVEVGLVDHGPNGTKELNEKRLKTPKMMRSFCSRILEQYKTKAVGIRVVGIVISGPYITVKVMSFNHASVGLVYTSPRLKMPERITEVARLLPLVLQLVYNCSQIIKGTVKHLEDTSTSVTLDSFDDDRINYFPPTFVSVDASKKESFPAELLA